MGQDGSTGGERGPDFRQVRQTALPFVALTILTTESMTAPRWRSRTAISASRGIAV